MANKSFKVKNGLNVQRVTQDAASISAANIDLAAGNFFTKTLSGDITVTFSNPPASGKATGFMLAITGGGGAGIGGSSYDSKLDDYSGQTNAGRGIAWKPDGTRYYLASEGTATYRRVYQYNLSTAWDISTASYSNQGNISSQASAAKGLAFKPDGTKMYVACDDNNDIFQYSLSTPWSISTISYDNKFAYIGDREGNVTDVTFKPDGTKMFIIGKAGDEINEYSLSTAWDVSTASYTRVKSVSSQTTLPEGFDFNSDGTELIVAGDDSPSTIHSYTLSTAYDISTLVFKDSFDASGVVNNGDLRGVVYGNNDTKFYTTDNQDDEINQFTVSGAASTITWPSSVKWPDGFTPVKPGIGSVRTYTLVTADGGTTYYGKVSGDPA